MKYTVQGTHPPIQITPTDENVAEVDCIFELGDWFIGTTPGGWGDWGDSSISVTAFHLCEANCWIAMDYIYFHERRIVECYYCQEEAPRKISDLMKMMT